MYRVIGDLSPQTILYSFPLSAFSGKLRSFLTKSGIEFEERFASDPRYAAGIVPAIGYTVVPALQLPDGTLLQDSTDAMLHLERAGLVKHSLMPTTPVLCAVAHLLNFIGTIGLLKPGMHYRWSFLDQQRRFLETEFADAVSSELPPAERDGKISEIMGFFKGYCPALGINEASIPLIESSWLDCLDLMNDHFSAYPYLLGDVPTIADCGLMTFVYPHLSRDPCPALVTKTRAPMVARWTERMNRREWFDGRFPNAAPALPANDEPPETLIPLLAHFFRDAWPEIQATIAAYNRWLDEQSRLSSGDPLDRDGTHGARPLCGEIEYEFRGARLRGVGLIEIVYQFQIFTEVLATLTPPDRRRFDALLDRSEGQNLIAQKPAKHIKYEFYQYLLA